MSVVDIDSLLAYMNNPRFSERNLDYITRVVLPGVQQQLEVYLGRTVEPVLTREACYPESDGYITLTNTPVWEMKNYVSNGVEVPFDTFKPDVLVPDNPEQRVLDLAGSGMSPMSYRHNIAGLGSSIASSFSLTGFTEPYLVVTYIGGYHGYFDQGLQLAIARVAARECERLFDPTRGIQAGTNEKSTDSDSRNKGWTKDELEAWDYLRRPTVVGGGSSWSPANPDLWPAWTMR